MAALLVTPAHSARLPERTHRMSLAVNGVDSDGASTRPAISGNGLLVAFDSVATNLALDPNGPMRDVFLHDVIGSQTHLVSTAVDGGGADGPSSHAAIGGRVVAFQSDATNLVRDDRNGFTDVFARTDGDAAVRVSLAFDGAEANGTSTAPDLSADGRRVVFTSTASNLVPGDGNGVADVFLRDLGTGTITRVSESGGVEGDGPSSAPAISADGRHVAFASSAGNLVPGDRNGIQDVFVADLDSGRVERVSVSSSGREQNRAVIEPFPQVADLSRNGRVVVFDSDATNLVRGDRNRDTDVFVRDRRRDITARVSVSQFGFEGDNDSFNPSITPSGRFIAFQSFASRLAAGDGPREDVFLFDLYRFAPTTLSVGHRGQVRNRERVRQLLQRPVVSDDGQVAAFTSTAGNLVTGDSNLVEDVFLRVTTPPRVRIVRGPRGTVTSSRPLLRLRADDRRVREFICNLDNVRIRCGRRTRLPRLRPGVHVLKVRAGGPGMLFQAKPLVRVFRVAR